MTSNTIPPLPVERADTRPVRIVPLHDSRAWGVFVTIISGTIGALTGGWFVWGLVIVNG